MIPVVYQIILGLSSAVLYLHREWDQCVVHGDIKPSNIMLDESFNAKLGDFGLARLINHGMSLQTMTAVAGTPGYLDPECVITGKASTESDIYSFGVVLLEVACGRRPMAPPAAGEGKDGQVFRLIEWAWDMYGQGTALNAADERLEECSTRGKWNGWWPWGSGARTRTPRCGRGSSRPLRHCGPGSSGCRCYRPRCQSPCTCSHSDLARCSLVKRPHLSGLLLPCHTRPRQAVKL
ncbi:hypothetical protein PR202_ga30042 [Eleusine coracana subsp. coracana]|uniref:Protein kinase domain-containing protein n=1 Tax=Eleusine coracana subsp. coracana TaxID=191504 RepID=A0AAV5DNW4_ELECO|nr:hypothetical protein PR202_ga30042 [Eleusine coracana subsp. coracana]